ncbi:competence protein ComK [Sporolactobacillus sp. CPB3-1]|uniref:Competence protein ComK n=1 Tax=Sporolactobacillus mangiferae TaxID=2940498 RepID=A0ABT0MCC8_9BACL|nr:competence protein ComK [Sporolactobacillus mangiferae]MCL1632516.1 competence protein ComK [Sporolactobacillus mangiferae]
MKIRQHYIIRPETMALLPYQFADGHLGTLVVEEGGEVYAAGLPKAIVERSCGYYGSSYTGRKKCAREMGYKSMPPICVCGELGIIFVASMTERSDYCAWLAFSHVLQWHEIGKHGTVSVSLTCDKKIELPMSPGPFSGRMMRAMQYRHQLRERISKYTLENESKRKNKPQRISYMETGTFYIHPESHEDDRQLPV